MERGLVLLVHGSRDPEWVLPFEELAEQVRRESGGAMVALACLQFSGPTLEDALAALAERGVTRALVVPVFISARGHVLKDVPAAVAAVKKSHPRFEIEVSPALGELPEVREVFIRSIAALRNGDT